MKNKELFSRPVVDSKEDRRIKIDSQLKGEEYVSTFGFEWTKIDGFVTKEAMSHGHIFGRFFLPKNFMFKM